MKKQLLFAVLIATCVFGASQMNAEIEISPPGEFVTPPAEVCLPSDRSCTSPHLEEPAAPAPRPTIKCIPGVDCPAFCDEQPGACVVPTELPPGDVPPTP